MSQSESKQLKETYSLNDFIDAEAELQELREKYHIEDNKKQSWWKRLGDTYVARKDNTKLVTVQKKKYCLIALFLGWLGVHQFMIGRKVTGILYLLTCWTGISFALSVLDIFQSAFLKVDENNCISI